MTKKQKSVYFWLRIINDMTQEDVSEKLLISLSYVRAIEAGAKKPSKRLLREYANLFEADESVITEFDATNEELPTKKFLLKLLTTIAERKSE